MALMTSSCLAEVVGHLKECILKKTTEDEWKTSEEGDKPPKQKDCIMELKVYLELSSQQNPAERQSSSDTEKEGETPKQDIKSRQVELDDTISERQEETKMALRA